MAASDSTHEVLLAPPVSSLPVGRPPPLRKGPASVAPREDAAPWTAPLDSFGLDDSGPEESLLPGPPPPPVDLPSGGQPPFDGVTRFIKPLSRGVVEQASEPPAPPPLTQAVATSAESNADTGSDESSDDGPIYVPRRSYPGLRSAAAFFTSMTVHMAGLIAAALVMVSLPEQPQPVVIVIDTHPEPEERVDTFELENRLTAATQFASSSAVASAAAASGEPTIGAPGSKLGIVGEPLLDKSVVALTAADNDLVIAPALAFAPSKERLVAATPDGALGDPRAVVDGYDEAFDRITQEILWMLAKRDVLVTWCFDQSESMKDDQQEIRDRVDRVYTELGLTSHAKGEHLLSAVTSFGQGFLVHTPRPTSSTEELRAAIESVPVDPSGKEMMCQAVLASIAGFHELARKQNRQMALILVTDESGERDNNLQFLEQALAAAKIANCRIYVLGREAVFGYPFAHMRWVHPQTKHEHWLQIDRGPETAFVEQLQTEGFRRRYDSFNSGFGPYEQTRLARETGGVFFMLPSTETKLVRDSEKRRYELEAMRSFRPDLRARPELFLERDKSPLKAVLSQIIFDLDPYRPQVAEVMEVAYNFPPHAPEFLPKAAAEQMKAKRYVVYLDAVHKQLELIRRNREQEPAPRWQANYDLVFAQVLAYMARTYEYGAMFDRFVAKPKIVPLVKPGHLELAGWQVEHSRQTVGGDLTKAYIDRSADLFRRVIEDYPGTPWAARAQWELDRGFGFELKEYYHYTGPRPPQPPSTPGVPLIPVPNL